MNNIPVINTTGLYYNYSKHVATLSDINLNVVRGSIYGFLGPNGSGKTTTLSLLLGLLKSDRGSIKMFGCEMSSNRVSILTRIGCLIENPSLYGHLTAVENLEVYKDIYGAPEERIAAVLKIVALEDTGNKIVKRFSLGMKQRLSLALALLPSPELLILDEPTNGLDPAGIIELREIIKKLNREEGITILISSHILPEVEKMVSHVGIISAGRMVFQGSIQELHQLQQTQSRLLIHTSDNYAAARILHDYQPLINGETITLAFQEMKQIASINRKLTENCLDVYLLQPAKADLEQLFIDLTSH